MQRDQQGSGVTDCEGLGRRTHRQKLQMFVGSCSSSGVHICACPSLREASTDTPVHSKLGVSAWGALSEISVICVHLSKVGERTGSKPKKREETFHSRALRGRKHCGLTAEVGRTCRLSTIGRPFHRSLLQERFIFICP